ncbi:MAG: DUF6364 family protein [Pseudomonadota bacterium]
MPQVSLYIDKETLEKIEKYAQKSQTSISKWVGNNLKQLIRDDYPDDFLGLFGAIQDTSFNRPNDLSFNADTKRMGI